MKKTKKKGTAAKAPAKGANGSVPSKRKIWLITGIVAAVAVITAVLLIVLLPGSEWEDRSSSKKELLSDMTVAEKYLEGNSYNVSIAALSSSTDASVESTSASVYITVDGDNYSFTEKRGNAQITYLYVDGVFYVNEEFIGVITKEPLAEGDAAIAENYKKYVSDYKNDIKLDDYAGFKSSKKDGILTVSSTAYSEEAAKVRNESLKSLLDGKNGVVSMTVDTTRSKITVKFDEQGRYSAITVIDATVVTYTDGSQDLVRSTYMRNYTYDNSTLVTPSDADNYIGMSSGYRDLFNQSFTVKTEISATSSIDTMTMAILGTMFGTDSLVKVDKNNYLYEYGLDSESGKPVYTETFIANDEEGGRSYVLDATMGESEIYRYYADMNEADFDYYYYQMVVSKYIPTLARGFNEITVADGEDGIRTVSCRYLSEDYFYALYESLNSFGAYSGVLVPVEDACTYTVVMDANGRYSKTEFLITVKSCTVVSGTLTENATYTYKVTRTFDYTEAEAFYKDAAEGDRWIKAPEDADKYSPMSEYY
jgi:hypothetical protein